MTFTFTLLFRVGSQQFFISNRCLGTFSAHVFFIESAVSCQIINYLYTYQIRNWNKLRIIFFGVFNTSPHWSSEEELYRIDVSATHSLKNLIETKTNETLHTRRVSGTPEKQKCFQGKSLKRTENRDAVKTKTTPQVFKWTRGALLRLATTPPCTTRLNKNNNDKHQLLLLAVVLLQHE